MGISQLNEMVIHCDFNLNAFVPIGCLQSTVQSRMSVAIVYRTFLYVAVTVRHNNNYNKNVLEYSKSPPALSRVVGVRERQRMTLRLSNALMKMNSSFHVTSSSLCIFKSEPL